MKTECHKCSKFTRNAFYPTAVAFAVLAFLPLSAQMAGSPAGEGPIHTLDPFKVTDKKDAPYKLATAVSANKTDTLLIDTPQSVQVLSEALIADSGATFASDLYKHVAGVNESSYGADVNFRGFRQTETRYNGISGNPYGQFSATRLSNVEQVEILSGPSSVLYGSSEPGGIINIVSRKPKATFQGFLTGLVANRNRYEAQGYVTGPVDKKSSLLYMVSFSAGKSDGFRANESSRHDTYTAGLSWLISPATRVSLVWDHIYSVQQGDRYRGVPADSAGNFLTDISFTTTEPTDHLRLTADVLESRADHVLNDHAKLNATFRWYKNEAPLSYHEPRGLRPDGRTMTREFRDNLDITEQYTLNGNLILNFNTGPVENLLLMGGEVYWTDSLRLAKTIPNSRVPTIDILNPVYGLSGAFLFDLANTPYATNSRHTALERRGAYIQDQIKLLNGRLQLVGALRFEQYDDKDLWKFTEYSADTTLRRLGALYKINDSTAVYTSYGEGYVPQLLTQQGENVGGPFEPQESTQVEVGSKLNFLEDRLGVGLAVYELTKTNVLGTDTRPTAPTGALISTGEVRSRGFEFTTTGQITKRWNINAHYAYNDVKITKDSVVANIGRTFINSPRHQVGAWTRYNFDALPLGAGVGFNYCDDRWSNETFTEKAQSYIVYDAALYYTMGKVKLQLNVNNLFDKVYALSSIGGGRIGMFPGMPRSIQLRSTFSF